MAEEISEFINSPQNAILLELNAHIEYDKLLAWGIEAISEGGVVSLSLFSLVVSCLYILDSLLCTGRAPRAHRTSLKALHGWEISIWD